MEINIIINILLYKISGYIILLKGSDSSLSIDNCLYKTCDHKDYYLIQQKTFIHRLHLSHIHQNINRLLLTLYTKHYFFILRTLGYTTKYSCNLRKQLVKLSDAWHENITACIRCMINKILFNCGYDLLAIQFMLKWFHAFAIYIFFSSLKYKSIILEYSIPMRI